MRRSGSFAGWLQALAAASLLLAGCGGGGSSASLSRVEIEPSVPVLAKGTSLPLTVTAIYSDGAQEDVTRQIVWSSQNEAIATVSNAEATRGRLTGVNDGSTKITGTYGTYAATATVTVSAAAPVSLAVTPITATLPEGASRQFTATTTFSDGTTQDVTADAAWSSSEDDVIKISDVAGSRGRAEAVAATGEATITATYAGRSATVTVTASAAVVDRIDVTPLTVSLAKGTSADLTATAVYTDGTSSDVTMEANWASGAPTVVTVGNTGGDTSNKGVVNALTVGTATISASFGGVTGSKMVTVTPAVLDRIEVTPTAPSTAKGMTRDFTATAIFSDASRQNVTADATWGSSEEEVATISNGGGTDGRASTLETGTTTISALYLGKTHSTVLTVTPAVVVDIEIEPTNPSVGKGAPQQFTATAIFSDDSTQTVTATANWSSGTGTVATISNAAGSNGRAQTLAPGESVIKATYLGFEASTLLTVTNAMLSRIEVTPAAPTLPLGAAQQFTATGVLTDGTTQALTTEVTWSSSDGTVVAISNADGSKGLAAATKAGNTTIKATQGAVSGSTNVTVSNAALAALQVTPSNERVAEGFQLQLKAIGRYTDSSVRDVTSEVTWGSTDASIASVSNAVATRGLATGVSAGTVAISVQQGGVSSTTFLTVTDAILESIEVTSATNGPIPKGTTRQFAAIGTFSDSSTKDLTQQVTWASSGTAVATVSNAAGSQGLAKAVAAGGPIDISATRGTIVGRASLTVTDATLVSIAVTPPTATVPKGLTEEFTATGTYTDGSTKDITSEVTWSSSATAVATVSNAVGEQGTARGVEAGTATIRASSGTISGEGVLTVSAAELTGISVTPGTASVAKGVQQQFTATGTYTDLSTRDITKEVAWTSSDATIATVSNDASAAGRAFTLKVGEATITATSGTLSDDALLTVTNAVLQTITVEPMPASLPAGTTKRLKAVGNYSDGTTQDLTETATWRSANAAIADVSNGAASKGLVFGKAAGTVRITATDSTTAVVGGVDVNVSAALLQAIVVSPANKTLPVGFAQQYTATGQFSDGVERDITTQVSWTAIDPTIVSIDNAASRKGLAQAVAAGNTVIVAQLNGVSGTTPVTSAALALTAIDVTPKDPSFRTGTVQFAATGAFAGGISLDLTGQVTWTSSNTGVARISNTDGSRGQASAGTGLPGTTTITARQGTVAGSTTLRRNL